jgi:hypothetical protein
MKTIFVMVKCDLGKAYGVADEAVLNIEQGVGGLLDLGSI